VSPNYEAHYGDFTDFNNPERLEERFGPAPVLGIGLNTGDMRLLEGNLREAFLELDCIVPGIRKKISYRGILYGDNGLISKDKHEELVNSALHN
jgi:hypothetical protein